MSHVKERKEKDCLNCNAIVAGRFCQVCGQENIETHETFRHLAGHFISDIFHFDGMFFSTSKYLLFKPGFLTHEYVRGRRASYLNPIKMYVFISAIFFLYFLTVYNSALKVSVNETQEKSAAGIMRELLEDKNDILNSMKDNGTPSWVKSRLPNALQQVNNNIAMLQQDSTRKFQVLADMKSTSVFSTNDYRSEREYDSIQKTMPDTLKDNWIKQKFERKNIEISNRFRENKSEMSSRLLESFFHHFPQTLFISLPLFALMLQLLYIRRKQFFYANHIIYTVHLYCAVFVFFFVLLLLNQAADVNYFGWLKWVQGAVFLYMTWYTYAALRRYYGQSRGKTFLKWVLLNIAAYVVIIVLFVFLFFFTMFTM